MAFSVTMTVSADGTVEVTSTDQLGGCPYPVATRNGGDMAGLTNEEAVARIKEGFRIWHGTSDEIKQAAAALVMCLPPAEAFDEDGRPRS